MMRRIFLLLACLLLFPFPASKIVRAAFMPDATPPETDLSHLLQPGHHVVTLQAGGRERKFVFVTPRGFTPGMPLPAVFFFHGAGGSAEGAARVYGWSEKAEAENFFAVFPEGLPARPDAPASFMLNPHVWRDGREMGVSNIDDVGFFQQLLDQLEAAVPIDPRRVYATGFSNGGGMCFVLAAKFPTRIAAIAPAATECFAHADSLARPVPVYYLVGGADPLVPYHGGPMTSPWGISHTVAPVQDSVDFWVRLDGCPPQPQTPDDANGAHVFRYGPGRAGSEVILTMVEGNGHHWPGSTELLPTSIVGPCIDPFKATDRVWDFFQKHPLPAPGQP